MNRITVALRTMKNKCIHVLKQTEFHILLVVLCFILFTWPFYVESDDITQGTLFVYILSSWLITIVLLFLISISVCQSKDAHSTRDHKPERENNQGPTNA